MHRAASASAEPALTPSELGEQLAWLAGQSKEMSMRAM
jgi:hypothetical protein